MLTPQQMNALIDDCWKQLLQLHKSLTELEKFNAQGREFLKQARRLPSTVNTTCSQSIDPESWRIDLKSWRKRAEEARALADITADATAKRSLLYIADAYETLAKPTKQICG
jgi:hypothetical protein